MSRHGKESAPMTHTKLGAVLAAVLIACAVTLGASCQPDPPGSWGCAAYPNSGPATQGSHGEALELNNDVFAPAPGYASNICGSNTDWNVQVTANACGGCIQAYPSIKYRYNQNSWVGCCGDPGGAVPLESVKTWTSSWQDTLPSDTNAQAAYDLWFNGPNENDCGALHGDVMIWVDTTASRGTGGGPVVNPHFSLDGRDTTVIQYGTPGVNTTETIYKFNTNEPVGSIDLMKVVFAEAANGDLKACNTTTGNYIVNADFGFEIAQTNGSELFEVPSFGFDIQTTDGVHHT